VVACVLAVMAGMAAGVWWFGLGYVRARLGAP
jgi:hypothetical protein